MSTKSSQSQRPATICCQLCGGSVPVAAKGNIPSSHFECAELLRTVRRLSQNIDAAAGVDGVNMEKVCAMLTRDVWGLVNDSVNTHANPAKLAKARKAAK
jgi:hypothetical protein